MKIKQTIGIDISKLTIDVVIHTNQLYANFENTNKGFKKMILWINKNNPFSKEQTFFALEHTGNYSYLIVVFLSELKFRFVILSGLEIKRSLGIVRGKDDKIDATKIALYTYRLRDEITVSKMVSKTIETLKRLLSLRTRLVKQRAGFKTSLKEYKRILKKKDNQILFKTQESF